MTSLMSLPLHTHGIRGGRGTEREIKRGRERKADKGNWTIEESPAEYGR